MRIVVIEDNEALAKGIGHRLRDQGHAVDLVHDGDDGDAFLKVSGADLVILDVSLPGLNGLDLLRRMRERGDNTPVLVLTARGDTKDRVNGLDAGADDYLAKPFEFDELLARLRAIARRRTPNQPVTEKIGRLLFDRGGRRLVADGEPIDLPRRELAVFECLVDRKGRLVPKSVIADHLYGTGADVEERVVEVYISRLRKRLADQGIRIKAARGIGYLLEDG